MNPIVALYVDGLSPEAEDRILVGRLRCGWVGDFNERCLIGWGADYCHGATLNYVRLSFAEATALGAVGRAFDNECTERGLEVVGAEIRQRILDNRAARMPAPQPLESHALAR